MMREVLLLNGRMVLKQGTKTMLISISKKYKNKSKAMRMLIYSKPN